MCGRFVQGSDAIDPQRLDALVADLVTTPGPAPRPSFNIAPTHHAAIIRRESAAPTLATARFGLIPSWADDESIGSRLINARSETVRAIVPMSGFYEWQSVPGERRARPWYIHRADDAPMLVGALWDAWTDAGSEVHSFTIITRAADAFVAPIHERMPLVLEPERAGAWLDPAAPDDAIDALLGAAPAGVLTGRRVSTRVNAPTHNDPALIEEDAAGDQGSLFG